MRFKFFFVFLISFFSISNFFLLYAEEYKKEDGLRVWLSPFAVEGDLRFTELGKQISDQLVREFELAGLNSKVGDKVLSQSSDILKEMEAYQAQAGIWGRLLLENGAYRLSARLIFQGKEKRFLEEGESMDTLLISSRDIAKRLADLLVGRKTVSRVEIHGNKRIESDAIIRVIKSGPGDVYLQKTLSDDLQTIYDMGYFDDIQVAVKEADEENVVIFTVKEKPSVRQVFIRGNRAYNSEKILESVNTKNGSILNIFQIRRDIERIRDLYKSKNYYHSEVKYEIKELENNQADLVFIISEGKKVKVVDINFEGRKDFTKKELLKRIESSEKGFFSWLTGSGDLKQEAINQDAARLAAFYHNEGYVDARVSGPDVVFDDLKVVLRFKIDEGERFRIGKVDVEGDLLFPKETLLAATLIDKEEWYKRDILHKDITTLSDFYGDMGYANSDIYPQLRKNPEEGSVDVLYTIKKGVLVSVDRIEIEGNLKTRDKVIRRQIPLLEQELYSGSKIRRGISNLNRLDYFETVDIDVQKTQDPEKVDLKVKVEEKPTGMFTFGAGYSSQDNLFGQVSVTQRNFLGKGQILNLRAEVGGTSTKYTLSFTEPYLFDIPLSAGFDIYDWDREYDDYTKKSTGGTIRFGYPVWDYTRAYLSYGLEKFDVKVDSGKELFVNDDILAMEPLDTASTLSFSLNYDSTNRYFNPSKGANHRATVKHAGGFLGGDIAFTKYTAELGWYFPLWWETIFFMHGETGYVHKNSNGLLPDYEKFYLGGMSSVRGYRWRDIAFYYDHELEYTYRETDEDGNITEEKKTYTYRKNKGGDKFVQFNLEYIFPLVKDAGLMGLLFYDMGNIFSDQGIDFNGIKRSVGYGIRWFSPVGPIRLEYGIPLDKIDGEKKSGRWEFTMGGAF